MTALNKRLFILVAILILILLGIVLWQTALKSPPYYAVFLQTGDIYFGQLTRFPSFGLKNVYTLQVNPQNEESPISIQRFRNIFWGPEDRLKINRDQVVWTTKLNPRGQLAEVIRTNPDLLPQIPTSPGPGGGGAGIQEGQ